MCGRRRTARTIAARRAPGSPAAARPCEWPRAAGRGSPKRSCVASPVRIGCSSPSDLLRTWSGCQTIFHCRTQRRLGAVDSGPIDTSTIQVVADWNPEQYRQFAKERGQAFYDLLDMIEPAHLDRAVDLGCGPGELTAAAAAQLDVGEMIGIDNSPAMLD